MWVAARITGSFALDRASGTLVTAFAGGTQISGFAVDGAELWSQATEGPVARLHEVGDVGAVMAHLENNPSDVGRFVAYGSADGSVWGESIAWPQIRDLDVSADGSTMVVSTGTSATSRRSPPPCPPVDCTNALTASCCWVLVAPESWARDSPSSSRTSTVSSRTRSRRCS